MKKIFLYTIFGCLLVSCTPPTSGGEWEIVHGIVTDEMGKPLQGILINYYATKMECDQGWAYLYMYSGIDGTYELIDHSHQRGTDSRDFILVVTDTAGVFQPQTIQATMIYTPAIECVISGYVGCAEVNIVMSK